MGKKIMIAPSILSANFSKMGEDLKRAEDAGADVVHIDVMDGVFVPNITFGMKMVKDLRSLSDLPFDCHLMIVEPWKYVEKFAAVGADYISVHYEACREKTEETLDLIRKCGVKCGLAINPDTPFESIEKYLAKCDLCLVMSVFPGFGGQKFMPEVLEKCKKAREVIDKNGYSCVVEIDGGINEKTIKLAADAGCEFIVAGSAVFGTEDITSAVKTLKNNCKI